MPGKKVAGIEAKEELKAILLADSFAQEFRPITLERPKVLLPLAGACLIDYALEWLAANDVVEVYVVCCANAGQVKHHIQASKWGAYTAMKVTPVVTAGSLSAGDALRAMDARGCVGSDFVLLWGDTVTNVSLAAPLAAHRARREKDRNAIMTLITKQVSSASARARLGGPALVLAEDPATNRLLRYQELGSKRRQAGVDAHFWGERDCVAVRADLTDSHIAICAPEVLMLFTDNFDYQDVHRDFIPGVLSEEELGNKLFLHTLTGEYAARVHSLRSLDAISRDVLQRWAFPFCPDTNLLPPASSSSGGGGGGSSSFSYQRHNVYREEGVSVARDAIIGPDTAIGAGTRIESQATVEASVIGRHCRVGRGARLRGAYLHDGCCVGEGATVEAALLCEGAAVLAGARVRGGAVLSFNTVVGPGHTVEPFARLSLCRQALRQAGSDDEGEVPASATAAAADGRLTAFGSTDSEAEPGLGEQPSAACLQAARAAAAGQPPPGGAHLDARAVGAGGAGFAWEVPGGPGELAGRSLTPPPPPGPEDDASSEGGSVTTAEDVPIEPLEGASEVLFKQEVSETVLRCVKDRHQLDNAIVELNGLKIAENKTFADVSRFVLSTLLGLCLPAPLGVDAEYRSLYPPDMPASDLELAKRLLRLFKDWGRLLRQYLKGPEEQVDLLLTLEEFCSEEPPFGPASRGARFVPIFPRILQLLYDEDFVLEDCFLEWAEEKAAGEEEEKRYVRLAAPFLDWLRNADEESEEDGSEESD